MVYFVNVMKSLMKATVLALIICNLSWFAEAMPRNVDSLSNNHYGGADLNRDGLIDSNGPANDAELQQLLEVLAELKAQGKLNRLLRYQNIEAAGDEDSDGDSGLDSRAFLEHKLVKSLRQRLGQSEAKRASINGIPMGFGK